MRPKRIIFVKPPDRFLENEFVYQQLGPHYLQSFLAQNNISSDLLVLYERPDAREMRLNGLIEEWDLDNLNMLFLGADGNSFDVRFDSQFFENYDIVGLSVMTPQAPDAYLLNKLIRRKYPHITSVIGGSHARYYEKQVTNLPPDIAFDFIVSQDGWNPMLQIATGAVTKVGKPTSLVDNVPKLTNFPAPSRPIELMERYHFEIGGAAAYHTITALGCPFTCHFCESGIERVRTFSQQMIADDLEKMSETHDQLGHKTKSVMFFDDVGLMSPKQVDRLSRLVKHYQFDTWRAYTHAYLIVKHKENLLNPFIRTGGMRVGIGLETGSQRSLDLINKRNGKKQLVSEHYEAVSIANELGIAVDAFTMIYPWEDEADLNATTKLVEFVVANKVEGEDTHGRPLRNYVDSTIMSPYQGTKFYDLMRLGKIPDVEINLNLDPGLMYYKGVDSGSGWAYHKTKLPKKEYEIAQNYRNSLRPSYR
jgi:radical SAM superfamily enzyme YgiQ (UPF0313 family)